MLWLNSVNDAAHVPTRAELTAGTDLTDAIAAIDGWTLSNQAIDVDHARFARVHGARAAPRRAG
ncbi:phage tail tube protein [Streptomyces sp. NPDC003006]